MTQSFSKILLTYFIITALINAETVYLDKYTLKGDKNYLSDYEPLNPDGSINVVIEIPTGTNQKWEVVKPDGTINWEFIKGKPRVVKYLSYPGNYGMIPKTLLPKELGGDGDPLDVIVLGSSLERGTVAKVKLIGVLKLLDGGEQDDKLIAVTSEGPFEDIESIEELSDKYSGVLDILTIWFTNYKGSNEISAHGYKNKEAARKVLEASISSYQDSLL